MDYNPLLATIAERYSKILGDNLVGIYIHGSIAFHCFNWAKSDIDFIVVVNDALSPQTKLDLLQVLEELCLQAPQKGFEMSVVLKKVCRDFKYPTPYELHFSNDWLERYVENPLLLCNDDVQSDYDLAAHFTVIKHRGIVLMGQPVSEVFGDIPAEHYLDSIRADIEHAKEDVVSNPIYVILNLCRVYAFMKTGLVLSKEEGGQWGMKELPRRYAPLLMEALKSYTTEAALETDEELKMDFAAYMLDQIFRPRIYP